MCLFGLLFLFAVLPVSVAQIPINPYVTAINPSSGPAAGGTTVTIMGGGFALGETVNFGTVAATSVSCSSSTTCTVVSPAETAGTVDVTVTTAGGTSPIQTVDQFTYVGPTATYGCSGFQTPFDQTLLLTHKTQRAIPMKMQLKDANGNVVTDQTIAGAPPVVNVTYSGVLGTGINDTALLDPVGDSTAGNAFFYDSTTQTWQFNLGSGAFTSAGTYNVTAVSGDVTKYTLSPTCSGSFVRQ